MIMLDDSDLSPGFGKMKIGRLTPEVISVLGLSSVPRDIVMWEDRYQYIQIYKNIRVIFAVKRIFTLV